MFSKVYKALFFAAGILYIAYMVNSVGWDVITANLAKVGIWFIPVIGSWLVIYVLNAFAFKEIIEEPELPGSNIPFLEVLRITVAGYAINYITPFVALGGEPYRIMELKPALGMPKATSSVLLYGLMHMFSHVLFWLASIFLIVAFVPINSLMLAGCGLMLVTGILLGYWFIRVYQKGFTVQTIQLLGKVPFLRKKVAAFAQDKGDTLQLIDSQIRILYTERKGRFYNSLFLEFAGRVVGCAEIYFTAQATGFDLSIIESLIVSSGSSLFANLIFFFPMQLGTREGGLALALKSVGFPVESGIFIGMVMRIRELVWIAIGLAVMRSSKPKSLAAQPVVNEELIK